MDSEPSSPRDGLSYTYEHLAPVALVSFLVQPTAFLGTVLKNIETKNGPVFDLVKDTARILTASHPPFDWEYNFTLLAQRYNAVFPELYEKADQPVGAVHGGVPFSRGCSVGLYKAGPGEGAQVYAVALVQMPRHLFKKWAKFAAAYLPEDVNSSTLTDSNESMRLPNDFVETVFVNKMRADLARMLFDSGAYYIQTLLFSLNLASSPQSLVHNPYHRDSPYHTFALSSRYMRERNLDGYTSADGTGLFLFNNPVHGLYLIQKAVGMSPFDSINDEPADHATVEPSTWERVEPAKVDWPPLGLPWRRKVIVKNRAPPPGAVPLSPLAGVYCLSVPQERESPSEV